MVEGSTTEETVFVGSDYQNECRDYWRKTDSGMTEVCFIIFTLIGL